MSRLFSSATHLSNPARISRIGVDRLQVFIRPVNGHGELVALIERLEQLLGAGHDTVDVIFEPAPRQLAAAPHNSVTSHPHVGTSTDANTSPPARR